MTRKEPINESDHGSFCKVWLHTLNSLWDRQQDAGDEGLTVVWLLEDGDLFSKTGAIKRSVGLMIH